MPVAYDYIVCGDDGGWRGQNSFDPTNPMAGFFIRIPKDSTPWPDCAGKRGFPVAMKLLI